MTEAIVFQRQLMHPQETYADSPLAWIGTFLVFSLLTAAAASGFVIVFVGFSVLIYFIVSSVIFGLFAAPLLTLFIPFLVIYGIVLVFSQGPTTRYPYSWRRRSGASPYLPSLKPPKYNGMGYEPEEPLQWFEVLSLGVVILIFFGHLFFDALAAWLFLEEVIRHILEDFIMLPVSQVLFPFYNRLDRLVRDSTAVEGRDFATLMFTVSYFAVWLFVIFAMLHVLLEILGPSLYDTRPWVRPGKILQMDPGITQLTTRVTEAIQSGYGQNLDSRWKIPVTNG